MDFIDLKRQEPTQKDPKTVPDSSQSIIKTPSHYLTGAGKYEPLLVLQEWNLSWCASNCIKYLFRAGKKQNTLQDLYKAQEYLRRLIETVENE